mgnify:CR=1 FL=1
MTSVDEPVETIRTAILTLAGRCDGARTRDGAGFNRYDTEAGHALASRIETGEAIDLAYAMRLASKYRRQLTAAGIVLPTAPPTHGVVPDTPLASPAPATHRGGVEIERMGAELVLRFGYDPALVEVARGLPVRRFDPLTKTWRVPTASLDTALVAFPGASLAGGLAEEVEAMRRAAAQTEMMRTAQVDADLAAYESIRVACALYEHQDVGVRWLLEHRSGIVADDMGLGKTRQSLVAARAIADRIIVVAPAGLRFNWLREAEAVDAQIEFYSWAKVPEPPEGSFTLIGDEAHYAQNIKAARTKRFLALARTARAVFLLTGTPIKNGRPANLYPLLVAIQHPLTRDRRTYERRYCNAGPTRWSRWDVTGAAHLDELHRKTCDGILRRLKSECLDLPAKTRTLRRVELDDLAQAAYDTVLHAMQAEYRRRKAAGEIDEADAIVLLTHLAHAGSLAKVRPAIEMAQEIIEQGDQVVLFTRFLDSAAQLASALEAGRITGDDDAAQRQEAIDLFQRGDLRAMVCTLGAGNVGINLTPAAYAILVDRPWTPGDAEQAEARLNRIGQTMPVTSIWLQVDAADAAIDALLEQKAERIELVLAGKRRTLRGIGSLGDVAAAVLGHEVA